MIKKLCESHGKETDNSWLHDCCGLLNGTETETTHNADSASEHTYEHTVCRNKAMTVTEHQAFQDR